MYSSNRTLIVAVVLETKPLRIVTAVILVLVIVSLVFADNFSYYLVIVMEIFISLSYYSVTKYNTAVNYLD